MPKLRQYQADPLRDDSNVGPLNVRHTFAEDRILGGGRFQMENQRGSEIDLRHLAWRATRWFQISIVRRRLRPDFPFQSEITSVTPPAHVWPLVFAN